MYIYLPLRSEASYIDYVLGIQYDFDVSLW